MHTKHPNKAYTPAFRKEPPKTLGPSLKQQIRPPMAHRSLPQEGGWRGSTSPSRHVGSSWMALPTGTLPLPGRHLKQKAELRVSAPIRTPPSHQSSQLPTAQTALSIVA